LPFAKHRENMATNTTTQAWATVPSELAYYDGVYQNGTVFLGGSDPEFNLGDTLVHEVGHVSAPFLP
jgi:hypothetical protein